MVKEKMSEGGRFLALFGEVKKHVYCGDNPAKVSRCYKESSNFQKIVSDLYWLHRNNHLSSSGQKIIQNVHDRFPSEWEDFEKRWLPEILDALFPVIEIGELLGELLGELSNNEDPSDRKETEESQSNFKDSEYEHPDYKYDEEFDPRWHDPSQVLDMGISYLEDQISIKEEFDYELANQLRIALGGWNFLKETIGIDFSGIARRWRSIPPFYIPQHVSNHHGHETGSLYDLLQSAYMAYVYGLYDPCIVMCRAISEKILKKHYPAQWTEWSDGKEENRPLKTIVKELREGKWGDEGHRYKKLINLIDVANSILHSENRKRESRTDEKYALACLMLVKEFIEKAPRKENIP